MNLNLLLLNDRLVRQAFCQDPDGPITRKYGELALPGFRRYLAVGDPKLSELVIMVAHSLEYVKPPTDKILRYFEEAFAASSASHGPNHFNTIFMDLAISDYRWRLKFLAEHGTDILDHMVTLAEELPFAVVVEDGSLDSICSSCFSTQGKKSRCIGCKVVSYFNKDCQQKDWIDHKHECSFLRNVSPNIPPAICRLMARIAMKVKRPDAKTPAFNGRVYEDLMDHLDEIQKDQERHEIEINSLVILIANRKCGRGLYLGLSAHDHSCVPDVRVIFDGKKANLLSANPTKKYSNNLTISYTETLSSNQDRKKKLQSVYYFTCTCERCSDPTLDFLYISARSTCCPDSYCLLDPDGKELTCYKCGSISGITIKEAVVANEEVKAFGDIYCKDKCSIPDVTHFLQTLIEAYEKFSKILLSFNLNMLLLNVKLVQHAFLLNNRGSVGRKYGEQGLPACRRYLAVGDMKLSEHLMILATSMAYERPPTKKILGHYEEAFAALSASHGPKHLQTEVMGFCLSGYRQRLQIYSEQKTYILDR